MGSSNHRIDVGWGKAVLLAGLSVFFLGCGDKSSPGDTGDYEPATVPSDGRLAVMVPESGRLRFESDLLSEPVQLEVKAEGQVAGVVAYFAAVNGAAAIYLADPQERYAPQFVVAGQASARLAPGAPEEWSPPAPLADLSVTLATLQSYGEIPSAVTTERLSGALLEQAGAPRSEHCATAAQVAELIASLTGDFSQPVVRVMVPDGAFDVLAQEVTGSAIAGVMEAELGVAEPSTAPVKITLYQLGAICGPISPIGNGGSTGVIVEVLNLEVDGSACPGTSGCEDSSACDGGLCLGGTCETITPPECGGSQDCEGGAVCEAGICTGETTPDGGVQPDAGGAPDGGVPDGGVPDGAVPEACDPVAQSGCPGNDKCGNVIVSSSPFLSMTACVPDGIVALGEACQWGAAGPSTGFSDCVAGTDCFSSFCRTICTTDPDSCGAGTCNLVQSLFDDLGNPKTTGLCLE